MLATVWQRFSERARKVVFYAQEEAQKFGEGYVSTEHLLLGLVRESDSTAIQALTLLGVDRARIRAEVEKQLPRGESRQGQDMTLTPRAKRVIDLAYDEARNLNHNYIGTEHLLLGLVAEGEGLAGRVLNKLGIELKALRTVVASLAPAQEPKATGPSGLVSKIWGRFGLNAGGSEPPIESTAGHSNDQIWERCTPRAQAVINVARQKAVGTGASGIGVEHLLLALLDDPECRGMRAISGLGADLERVRAAAQALAAQPSTLPITDPLPFSITGQMAIASADVAAIGMANPFLGTEHLALILFGGAAGELVDPTALAPARVREAVLQSQAED